RTRPKKSLTPDRRGSGFAVHFQRTYLQGAGQPVTTLFLACVRRHSGMAKRRWLILVLAGIFPSLGAAYPTTNFLVEAPNAQIAQQVGQWAEHYRREKAIQWLGSEMPPWPERCPLHVKITFGSSGGATSFNFDFAHGQVWQTMQIEGSLDRLLASVL